jgi:acetolactate synthase I/II/III large subunit
MGHAVAGAIGGKLAAPGRPVVALVGDGAFAMNGMEVHTAVENDIPVIWVVLNNGGHGMVHLGEVIQFKGKFNTSLFRQPLDIAKMGEAMGAQAFRARLPGETEQLVKRALASGRPTVIDVRIDPEERPPTGMRLATLERFFNKKAF